MLSIKNNKYNLIILFSIHNIYYSIKRYNIFTKCKYYCSIKKILLYLTLVILCIVVYLKLSLEIYNFKKEFESLKYNVRNLKHKASKLDCEVDSLRNKISVLTNLIYNIASLMVTRVNSYRQDISQPYNQDEQQSIVGVSHFSGQHFRLSS